MKRSREFAPQANTAVFWIWLPSTLPNRYRRHLEDVIVSQQNCDFYLICNLEANTDANLPIELNLVPLAAIINLLKTLNKEHSIDTGECIEFVECHEDLTHRDGTQAEQHQHEDIKSQDKDAFVMLSDLLRVHYSLHLLLTRGYESVLYLDTDIEPEISPSPIPLWLSESTPIRLSRDDLLVDFDILGIHISAIGFLKEIQNQQSLFLQKESFHDSKNRLKRALFNPLGREIINPPDSVAFVEKDNERIDKLTPPPSPMPMTLWNLPLQELGPLSKSRLLTSVEQQSSRSITL